MRRLRSACRLHSSFNKKSAKVHITTGVVFSGDKSQFDFRTRFWHEPRNVRVERSVVIGSSGCFYSCLTIKIHPSSKIGQSPPCTLVRIGWNYTPRKRSEFHGHRQLSIWSRGVVVRD